MPEFLTPQHPSSMQRSHCVNEPREFLTPQHPAMGIPWGIPESPNFGTPQRQGRRHHPGQFGTHPNPAAFGAKGWDWGSEPRQFRTPQHRAAGGEKYWGTADGSRPFGTPQRFPVQETKGWDWGGGLGRFGTPKHRAAAAAAVGKNYWGTVDGTRPFGTPLRPDVFPDFRTPQHPSQGTNNWGGASPLLARNIAQESLDEVYERVYTVRTQDDMLMTGERVHHDDDDVLCPPRVEAVKCVHKDPPTPTLNPNANPNPSRRRGMLWKLIKRKPRQQNPPPAVEDSSTSKKKKGWLSRFGLQKRRPTGWH